MTCADVLERPTASVTRTWMTELKLDHESLQVIYRTHRVTLTSGEFDLLKTMIQPEFIVADKSREPNPFLTSLNQKLGHLDPMLFGFHIPGIGYYWSEKLFEFDEFGPILLSKNPAIPLMRLKNQKGAVFHSGIALLREIALSPTGFISHDEMIRKVLGTRPIRKSYLQMQDMVDALTKKTRKTWGENSPDILQAGIGKHKIGYYVPQFVKYHKVGDWEIAVADQLPLTRFKQQSTLSLGIKQFRLWKDLLTAPNNEVRLPSSTEEKVGFQRSKDHLLASLRELDPNFDDIEHFGTIGYYLKSRVPFRRIAGLQLSTLEGINLVKLSDDSAPITLSKLEFKLLKLIAESPGSQITRIDLIQQLWPNLDHQSANRRLATTILILNSTVRSLHHRENLVIFDGQENYRIDTEPEGSLTLPQIMNKELPPLNDHRPVLRVDEGESATLLAQPYRGLPITHFEFMGQLAPRVTENEFSVLRDEAEKAVTPAVVTDEMQAPKLVEARQVGDLLISVSDQYPYVQSPRYPKPIEVRLREFRILLFLSKQKEFKATRQEIINNIWQEDQGKDSNRKLTSAISVLNSTVRPLHHRDNIVLFDGQETYRIDTEPEGSLIFKQIGPHFFSTSADRLLFKVKRNSTPISLVRQQFDILKFLGEQPAFTASKKQIAQQLWPEKEFNGKLNWRINDIIYKTNKKLQPLNDDRPVLHIEAGENVTLLEQPESVFEEELETLQKENEVATQTITPLTITIPKKEQPILVGSLQETTDETPRPQEIGVGPLRFLDSHSAVQFVGTTESLYLSNEQFELLKFVGLSRDKVSHKQISQGLWPRERYIPAHDVKIDALIDQINRVLRTNNANTNPLQRDEDGKFQLILPFNLTPSFTQAPALDASTLRVRWKDHIFALTESEFILLEEFLLGDQIELNKLDIHRVAFSSDPEVAVDASVRQILNSLIRKFKKVDPLFSELRKTPFASYVWTSRAFHDRNFRKKLDNEIHYMRAAQ